MLCYIIALTSHNFISFIYFYFDVHKLKHEYQVENTNKLMYLFI